MREAKVTCLCAEYTLTDLNLKLTQGQTVWLSVDQVKLSQSLVLAGRIGAVGIEWKERARVTKPPPPPNFRRLTPGQRKKVQPEEGKPAPSPSVVVQTVDEDALRKHVQAAVAGELQGIRQGLSQEVAALREDLAAQVAEAMKAQGQPIDQDTLAATLASVLQANLPASVPSGASAAAGPAQAATSDGPLYIPSGIVEQDVQIKGESTLTETTSDAGGADAAAKKLKKLKKQRKPSDE